jgi:hypothetical protein
VACQFLVFIHVERSTIRATGFLVAATFLATLAAHTIPTEGRMMHCCRCCCGGGIVRCLKFPLR